MKPWDELLFSMKSSTSKRDTPDAQPLNVVETRVLRIGKFENIGKFKNNE